MTQEDKDLLLKDLCSRLPYEVKVQYEDKIFEIDYVSPMYEEVKLNIPENYTVGVSEVKPYLVPISSITEEQRDEYINTCEYRSTHGIANEWIPTIETVDWYNENHIDYRGLIENGLAIDATGLNIY